MGESAFRLALGESWDVVEVVRSLSQAVGLLTTEVDALQRIVAQQEARLQVLEAKQVLQVGELVAESEAPTVKPARSVKGEAQLRK